MNGRHDNFRYTQDQPNDPTAESDGSYVDESGARLRDLFRFCLWCQQLVTLRILERTDQLADASDPASFIDKGQRWYERWTTNLRDGYWELFDVSQQIVNNEGNYAAMTPGSNDEPLETSDLYSAFREDAPTVAGSSSVGADEWLLLLG